MGGVWSVCGLLLFFLIIRFECWSCCVSSWDCVYVCGLWVVIIYGLIFGWSVRMELV